MDWRALVAGVGCLVLLAFAGYGFYVAAMSAILMIEEMDAPAPVITVEPEVQTPPPDCSPLERFYFPVPGFYEPSGKRIDV